MTDATNHHHEQAIDWLDERESRFVLMADRIWDTPEVALTESTACRIQADDLAADGFTIRMGVGDLPTAFVAEYAHGDGAPGASQGPIIGFLGEYDALPSLSQERSSTQSPIVVDGPGHGCGHNLLGTASLAAASVVKAWLIATDTPGTVRYYGCPAEETVEGKVYMTRAGAFDDLDLAITWHPGSTTGAKAGSSLAANYVKFRFFGRTAHAAANPETGRSALDAVELMNIGVNYLREHMIDQARIHYVITHGGGAPNVVPDDCEVWHYIRSPKRPEVDELVERVRNIARGAALMTETRFLEDLCSAVYNYLPNMTLTEHMQAVLEDLGPIAFTDEEIAYARQVADAFPRTLREGTLVKSHLPASIVDDGLNGDPWPIADAADLGAGSTDVADVSWVTPTAQINTTCVPLGVPFHSWAVTATVGMSIGHKGMLHAAKAMAITAIDAFSDPLLIAAAREEFANATAATPYRCAIPADVMPRRP
ncbi:MAG: amidohydrolase [Thermomicrobiales bacterium]